MIPELQVFNLEVNLRYMGVKLFDHRSKREKKAGCLIHEEPPDLPWTMLCGSLLHEQYKNVVALTTLALFVIPIKIEININISLD